MSTSARELAEHHERVARVFPEVERRYPGAIRDTVGDDEVMLARRSVDHDHVMVIGDSLMPCERVEVDGSWVPVVNSPWDKRPTCLALKYLKEKHPSAYAGLIQWLVKG